jgi:hypothetical protein
MLIIGDLNAYAMEDPITALKEHGYTDLIQEYVGSTAYSYVYKGETGYLDHALATASMAAQVTGMTGWHINADEPRVLDYNTEYKSDAQVDSLYSADAYRSSDHDPVLIAFDLFDAKLYYDLNGDGVVDRADINIIRTHINQPASVCPKCDINRDGTIDMRDMRKLMQFCTNAGCRYQHFWPSPL